MPWAIVRKPTRTMIKKKDTISQFKILFEKQVTANTNNNNFLHRIRGDPPLNNASSNSLETLTYNDKKERYYITV